MTLVIRGHDEKGYHLALHGNGDCIAHASTHKYAEMIIQAFAIVDKVARDQREKGWSLQQRAAWWTMVGDDAVKLLDQ